MSTQTSFRHNTVAIVYDFDGTLTPQPMQEYTVFPELKISGKSFWKAVKKQAEENNAEEIVTYMRLMLEKASEKKFSITKQNLEMLGPKIKFYPGIERGECFNRINEYVREKSAGKVKVRHYLISAGIKEILQGTDLRKLFHNIFASEYFYDHNGVATFPNVIVNDTLKTQFLFRINKGLEKLHQNINTHMPFKDRVIPFENILYIGDGMTDVPCMSVLMRQGGYAMAVHQKGSKKGKKTCVELFKNDRVDFYAPADYREGSTLDHYIKTILDRMVGHVGFLKETFALHRNHKWFTNGT